MSNEKAPIVTIDDDGGELYAFGKGPKVDSSSLSIGDEYTTLPSEPDPEIPLETKSDEELVDPKPFKRTIKGVLFEAETQDALLDLIASEADKTPEKPVDKLSPETKQKYQPFKFERKELSLQEQAEIINLWKVNPQLAHRKLQEAEFGASSEVLVQTFQRQEALIQNKLEEEAGVEFLYANDEYRDNYSTGTNAKKLTDYLRGFKQEDGTVGLPITSRNLSYAFQELRDELKPFSPKQKAEQETQPEAEAPKALNERPTPPPPVSIPASGHRVTAPETGGVDVGKFAAMSVREQKEFLKKYGSRGK